MPISRVRELRITEEVRPLQVQLEEAKSLAAKYMKKKNDAPSTSSSSSVANQLIEDISGEIQCITRIFSQLEVWERDMKGKIGDIAKELNKALEDGNNDENENEFLSKLLTTKEKVSCFKESLRTHNCPLRLDQLEAYAISVPHVSPSPDFSLRPSTFVDTPVSEKFQFDTTISEDRIEECIRRLPIILKWILVLLCIFPVGSLIKRKTLYYCWWWGLKYFPEDVPNPEFCFNILFRRLDDEGLINCTYKNYEAQKVDSCVINPLAHKAVINLIHHDHSISDFVHRVQSSLDPAHHADSIRYLAQCICDPLSIHPILLPGTAQAKFVSYVNVNHNYLKFEKFLEMKDAVVLSLGRWHSSAKHHIEVESIEFLEWLGSFRKLRVLSLRGISRITELPRSIGELKTLHVLDLRACYDLQRLPVELTSLESLWHLDTTGCYFLSHMPKGIGLLRRLRTLQGFVVGNLHRHEACQLGELSKLRHLIKLSIDIGRDSVLEDEEFNKLSSLTSLKSLQITWSVSKSSSLSSNRNSSALSRVLTVSEMDVSPPPNLRKLDLRCFPQSTRPRWLHPRKLIRLKKLYIRGGNLKLSNLCEGNLLWDTVKVLRLRFLQGVDVEQVWPAFPNLHYLEIHNCNDYKLNHQWSRPNGLEEEESCSDCEERRRRLETYMDHLRRLEEEEISSVRQTLEARAGLARSFDL